MNALSSRTKILLIVIVGFLVYGSSLLNGFIIGDDEDQILNNPLVHNLANIPTFFAGSTYYQEASQSNYGLFYRPLMLSSYALIYNAFGPDPFFFHLIQLSFHITNSLLVYAILSKISKGNLVPFVSALLFLIHPINSETVLHIANLQEVLFLFFGLTSFYLLLINKWGWSWLLFTVALFAKESAVLFLTVIIVYLLIYAEFRQKWRLISGYLIGLGFYLWCREIVANVSYVMPSISRISELTHWERLSQVPSVIWFYLKTFVWPDTLVTQQFWLNQGFWMPLFGSLIFFGITWFVLRSIRSPRSLTLFFCAWFLLGLGLHSQILPLYLTVADRWFYFSSVAGCVLIAMILESLIERKLVRRNHLLVGVVILVGGLSMRTIVRSFDWRDSYSLLSADINAVPEDFYNENLLATLFLREEKYDLAEPLLISSVSVHSYVGNLSNLAIVKMKNGQYQEADSLFQQALEEGKVYQSVINYLNFKYYVLEETTWAQTFATQQLEEYPQGADLYLILAQTKYLEEDNQGALMFAKKAHQLKPNPFSNYVLQQIQRNEEINYTEYIY